ncbi:hypothetical protein APA_4528 [Pseudanabaena sp. lw0831]|nr:hypothetical protein APA_4528 [Pseudanabaena sp. lw0831]
MSAKELSLAKVCFLFHFLSLRETRRSQSASSSLILSVKGFAR